MSDSRISGFYRLSVGERIAELERRGWLSSTDADALKNGRVILPVTAGDKIIENVIATFGLPLAVVPNFRVNDRDYLVPLVVEEPSIVAALSASALLARSAGGFDSACDESLLAGQVHLTGISDVDAAIDAINNAKQALLAAANDVHPRLVRRGGGVRDIESRNLLLEDGRNSLVVHLLVDTGNAMGANLVNTICEAIAPQLAELCNGNIAMRILSNLADRSLVTAKVNYGLKDLGEDEDAAKRARDAIVLANDIACADPYRAATHNKGIMNGIDPLAVATGNDWRAIEAGAHAYAAVGGAYSPLTCWSVSDTGDLAGEIRIPLKVGIVGGTREANATAALGLRICGVESARELAELMAAVGLAQNFAAIRALSTSGIQQGHMRLHARSVAAGAGVPDKLFDDVVAELVASGEIKDWKAREILIGKRALEITPNGVTAAGKLILLGEHAVVYGAHALAMPIKNAVTASAKVSDSPTISIPAWGVDKSIEAGSDIGDAVLQIARELGVADRAFNLSVATTLPRAMGLGSSAALAVAITRALGKAFDIDLDNDRVNSIAFECEKLAHGTPSGVDNTVATFATPFLYRRNEPPEITTIELLEAPPVVVACSNSPGSTLEQVAGVRARRDAATEQYDALFEQIDALTIAGADALAAADYERLGGLMNICHGLLNAIQVSTPELEHMVSIARAAGALGAKLTGAGGGGSIVALCPGREAVVSSALEAAGFMTIAAQGNEDQGVE
ncbi:MAG: hydroxymethylglutaryl-CoA reductase, degradative [Gammaproteobacteria bacterium]|nr:hydroxymethylglutaryl-CoA reductase, degradative [Gammaproteobacteria bacterium]